MNDNIYANYKDIYLENSRIIFFWNSRALVAQWALGLRQYVHDLKIRGNPEKWSNSHIKVAYDQWSESKPNEMTKNPSNSRTMRCIICTSSMSSTPKWYIKEIEKNVENYYAGSSNTSKFYNSFQKVI